MEGLRQFLKLSNRVLADPEPLGLDPESINLESGNSGGKREAPMRPRGGSAEPIQEPVQEAFRAALAAGEEKRCFDLVQQRIAAGGTRAEAAEDLIADAMRGLGDAWNCGDLEVYQERRSCNICTRLIHSLRDSVAEPAPGAPVAIGGAPETDPYQLPTSLVELALRERGWNAINLGNNLPLESLIQAVSDYRPRLVWLSVTSVADPGRLIREQNKLANSLDPDVAFLVGGRGLDDHLRPKLRYTAHCDSLRHLIEFSSLLLKS